jgi:hypothetical protein
MGQQAQNLGGEISEPIKPEGDLGGQGPQASVACRSAQSGKKKLIDFQIDRKGHQ